ncbi:T9SS type A sorting domain-containing protein [Hymenobacter sp. GOD-10R]|uniref:T9SS type A sorting domain-containing protein n=1 Tax=Hymenobacter sp. GOD-10R TaxID=3093922 RepID=UPI002D7872E2|nr:T9SS type A sorting domain-containing protein [Hymenobacter sp. GOD-10R]WRQ26348.1 T9SS type A sorting domain-containing protein [Hymenobacter sp. GOD-10R]
MNSSSVSFRRQGQPLYLGRLLGLVGLLLALLVGNRTLAQQGSKMPTPSDLHWCRPEALSKPGADLIGKLAGLNVARMGAIVPEVRLIYLVPSDRTINPVYAGAIANAARDLRRWYQQQLGNTKTFTLHSPVVETYQTTHSVSWYQTNPNGAPFAQFYYNAAQDVFAITGGTYYDPNYVYAIYIDAESSCGQCGGCGGGGVLVVNSNDLRGLVGQPAIRMCANDPEPVQYPPCRWVGGLGHELGHAFGLPHPPGCDEGQSTCDYNDLMWLGYIPYPATYLRASEQATLNQSPFFTAQSPATGPTSCNILLATHSSNSLVGLSLSPNPAHASVTVQLPALVGATQVTLTLIDALGRTVSTYTRALSAGGLRQELALSGLTQGVYVVHAQVGTAHAVRRLLVE